MATFWCEKNYTKSVKQVAPQTCSIVYGQTPYGFVQEDFMAMPGLLGKNMLCTFTTYLYFICQIYCKPQRGNEESLPHKQGQKRVYLCNMWFNQHKQCAK